MRIFIIALLVILSSCTNKPREFIDVHYLSEGLLFSSRVPCGAIQSKWYTERYHHKTISDEKFIGKFKELYENPAVPTEMRNVDARIVIHFHHENKVDTICMGEHFSVAVNGEMKGDYPELLKLVKKEIYKEPER